MGSPEEKDDVHMVDMTENVTLTDVSQTKYTSKVAPDGQTTQWTNKDKCEVTTADGRSRFSVWLEHRKVLEKGIFVLSIVTIAALTHGLLTAHWLIPYYFAVAAPVLISIRFILYWKLKYQYFLLDFCYFGNLCCYIYMWAVPHNQKMFMVLFGLTNGPLLWAIIFFRNSLVFHSGDKMTSLFIHTIPPFLTYSIRWYPESTAMYWYSSFVDELNLEITYLCIWLIAVPLAMYMLHGVIYMLLVYGILKPNEDYLNSFRYLRDQENIFGRLINICGPRFTWFSYYAFYWTYCVMTLAFTVVWFKYYLAHSIFILVMCVLATWNGASYYIDVFAVRGFKEES